jgi:hypothetical protein
VVQWNRKVVEGKTVKRVLKQESSFTLSLLTPGAPFADDITMLMDDAPCGVQHLTFMRSPLFQF